LATTLTLAPAEIAALRARLDAEGFELGPLDHAHYQARGRDVVVNAYRSGKVVVQGKGEAGFLREFGFAAEGPVLLDVPTAGSDESGKGDYFGPLAVAAAVVTPEQAVKLGGAGVRDCKKMGDAAILKAAKLIRDLCPHEVLVLTPLEYNRRHEKEGNVALFLSTLHAQAIAAAARRAPRCERVVIDQFTHRERLEEALRAEGVRLPVEIRHRAEDNPAVAAASVLARAEFLLGLRELGHEHGLELPKGAGEPVVAVGREIFRAGGMAALSVVAKTHFKTTRRVTGELF
jgi:ribonuclease HIII